MIARCLYSLLTVACLAALASTQAAQAQFAATDGAVSGMALAEVKKPAEVLRVHIDVLAKGKDLKEALTRLKERREAARVQLTALGAMANAIEFGEIQISTEANDPRKQMERMIRARMGARGGKDPDKGKQAPAVSVSVNLKADLPLKAANAEELLVVAHGLQEKIKAADLSGLKEIQKLSPQEEEAVEEGQMMMHSGNPNEVKPGEPTFVFVCPITEAERAKALAEAFQKARKDALGLAQAAGETLGALRNLSTAEANADPSEYGGNMQYYYMMQRFRTASGNVPAQALEAVGMQPGKVSYRTMLSASFALQAPR